MKGQGAIEVAKTVLEVADVAWTAMEYGHHHNHHKSHEQEGATESEHAPSEDELEALRLENRRLRNLLEQNLKLLQDLSESPSSFDDCPPDLYARLVATVDSEHFLGRLKSLQQASGNGTGYEFPFREATGDDLQSAEILIKVDGEEPSWWVWVTDEMVPSNVEERSGIDKENYVVVTEEHVVDGVANFMARCIMSNPKARNMTPVELQKSKFAVKSFENAFSLTILFPKVHKALAKALGNVSKLEKVLNIWHAGKLFYALSTWGLALAGLYRSRAVLKLAATGVHTTSKVILRAL